MKTVQEFVDSGISKLCELQDALETAMRLEFATIPPYLCAQWSIDSDSDPSMVSDTIEAIVVQEMFHLALAGNMLSAIKGNPQVTSASFLTTYPANELPGGIAQKKPVDLKPLSDDQLEVFMQIEYPQFTPVAILAEAVGPATIGDFYDIVIDGFNKVNPTFDKNAPYMHYGKKLAPIQSVQDAVSAINRIKGEGEGTMGSPDQPPEDAKPEEFAHYYKFKEVLKRHQLIKQDGKWDFVGPEITFPKIFPFKKAAAPTEATKAFSKAFSSLLVNLQESWTKDTSPSISKMRNLRDLGQDLIQKKGIAPEFVWAP
jgi:hypothetical protein